MPWPARALALYHGTIGPYADNIAQKSAGRNNGIDLRQSTIVTDFGPGFYTTRILAQAVAHANVRYQEYADAHARSPGTIVAPQHAVVIEFGIALDALGALDTLAFVQPAGDWLDFVRFCRLPSGPHKADGSNYEAVYGPVWATGAGAVPDWEQLSLHSDYATLLLDVVNVRRGGPLLP